MLLAAGGCRLKVNSSKGLMGGTCEVGLLLWFGAVASKMVALKDPSGCYFECCGSPGGVLDVVFLAIVVD